MRVSNGIACLQLFKSDSCIEMQLPAWIHSGKEVLYVFMDGERMMEVYEMDGGTAKFKGIQPCDCDLSKYSKLEGPWLKEMEKLRRRRIQGIGNLGQPRLF